MEIKPEDIFTPQGRLEDVQKNPNLDFLMNIFNIPRAFGVSGFGNGWNVGQHCFATALISLYWSKFNHYDQAKTNQLTTEAMLHDLHEAVTGDILPMFKEEKVKTKLDEIQGDILKALKVTEEKPLHVDLKVCDIIAFIYEIKQVSPNILNSKKLTLANTIAHKQTQILFSYGKENGIGKEKLQKFLTLLDI